MELKKWFTRGAIIGVIMMIVHSIQSSFGTYPWSPGLGLGLISVIALLVNWTILGYVATWVLTKW